MANNENMKEKAKEGFSNLWKKASDLAGKTADSAKTLAEQTKQSIHDQKAKRYSPLTEKDMKAKSFRLPDIIYIEDDLSNREFVTDKKAVGWLEAHKDEQVFHIYRQYADKCGLTFLPLPQKGSAYYKDKFDAANFVDVMHIFEKSTHEKLAELVHIADCLGAKHCEALVDEKDAQADTFSGKLKLAGLAGCTNTSNATAKQQSGYRSSSFKGHDNPLQPTLKWFAHDSNILGLIEQRSRKNTNSDELVLYGAYSATMTKSAACALDDLLGLSGKASMEAKTTVEHSSRLIFRVEF